MDVKWVRPKSIHITLKFLGDTPTSKIEQLADAAQNAVGGFAPFTVSIEGTGGFPSERRPRVLWIGIHEGDEKLVQLAVLINKALTPLGFALEKRPFSPHVTIGRVRSLKNIDQVVQKMKALDLAEKFPVNTIEFIKSDLKPTGAEYTVLKEIHMKT